METLQLLNEKIQEREHLLIRNAKEGKEKIIGYTCIYTPVELIRAAGLTPLRLFKGGDEALAAKGEFHLRSYFCHFSQSTIGAFRSGDPLYTSCDRICAFGTCDQMRRTLQQIDYFYKPAKIYSLPKVHDRESAKGHIHYEIIELKKDLESITGKPISDEALWEQIKVHNQLRELIRKISSLRKRENPQLSGKQFIELTRGYFYLPPNELIPLYSQIYKELSNKNNNDTDHKLRLMIAGGIIADGDLRVIEQIEEELGANIVVEDHCTGLRPFYHNLDEKAASPLEAISSGYLNHAPCARMRPITDRVDFAGKLAKEYEVDGVIYIYLKFCSTYGIPKKLFIDHFKGIGLPVLEIANDYSHSDTGQLRTRFEAFFEMIQQGVN